MEKAQAFQEVQGGIFLGSLVFQFGLSAGDQWSVLERFRLDRSGRGLDWIGFEDLRCFPVLGAASQTHRKD